jgi:hypothetical protein
MDCIATIPARSVPEVDWNNIYTGCFVLGLTVVVASFLLGHLGGGDHGGGGHDAGGGHDMAGGHDGDASGHSGTDGADHGHNPPLPLFSPGVLSVFVGMFGIGGLLLHKVLHVEGLAAHVLGASGLSLASGFGMAFAMRGILKATEHNSIASFRDVIGQQVEVLTAIRGRELGEIAYTSGGARQTLIAKSEAGVDFPQGAQVHVLDIREGIAYVGERGGQPLVGVRAADKLKS